jgi:hypothetical protein
MIRGHPGRPQPPEIPPAEAAGRREAGSDRIRVEERPRDEVRGRLVGERQRLDDPLREDSDLGDGRERNGRHLLQYPGETDMQDHRQPDQERPSADDRRDPPDRLAQRHLVRSEHRDRAPGEGAVDQGRLQNPCDVGHRHGPDRPIM